VRGVWPRGEGETSRDWEREQVGGIRLRGSIRTKPVVTQFRLHHLVCRRSSGNSTLTREGAEDGNGVEARPIAGGQRVSE